MVCRSFEVRESVGGSDPPTRGIDRVSVAGYKKAMSEMSVQTGILL